MNAAITLASIWNTVYPVLIAVLFFEVIIIIHEAGHFTAARLMKIKVNEFSIGMGPKVFSVTRRGTKYSLRWILFGGYCSMEGENDDSDSAGSFASKKVIQRIFVVAAGAVMNLLLGFLIIVIITCSQSLVGTTTIAKFEEGAASAASGLQTGDVIKSIDGMKVYTSTDVTTGLSRSADGNIEMVVERDGETVTLNVQFDFTEEDGQQYVSMDFWLLGLEKTFGNVLSNACATFVSYAKMVFLSLHDLIVGRYHITDLSGPVGAVSIVSDAVKTSSIGTLRLMALITINVGLFNLFPIPALDGWRLFLLIGEGIFRKKLPPKWEYVINAVGLVLLLLLMVFVTFSDITKLF